MKLRTLIENVDENQLKRIASKLQTNCSQYLSELGDIQDCRLYRGFQSNDAFLELTPNTSRKPIDTDVDVHHKVDAWLMKNHGIAGRSQAVFTTGNKPQAKMYGVAYSFFPVGPFSFVWSENVYDLTIFERKLKDKTDQELDQILNKLNYRTDDLKAACESRKEVMVKCDKYYLVRNDIIEDLLYYKIL